MTISKMYGTAVYYFHTFFETLLLAKLIGGWLNRQMVA